MNELTPSELAKIIEAVVPLLQTIIYIFLILFFIFRFKNEGKQILQSLRQRVIGGASISIGGLTLGETPTHKQVSAGEASGIADAEVTGELQEFIEYRKGSYNKTLGLYLFHVLQPSKESGQKYDVGVFIAQHDRKGKDYGDIFIQRAQFFAGRFWQNRIFEGDETDLGIGFTTSAYGEFLVVCLITLKDGRKIWLKRYIDFKGIEKSHLMPR